LARSEAEGAGGALWTHLGNPRDVLVASITMEMAGSVARGSHLERCVIAPVTLCKFVSISRFAAGVSACFRMRRACQVIGYRDKNLSILEGRHSTDPNVAVCIGAVPYTVPEHECRGIIAPGRDCVHRISMQPRTRAMIVATKSMERRLGCSCARGVGSKC